MVVSSCVGLRQFTPVSGISITGESTVFNSSNGTAVFGFRVQSQIPTSNVVLGYLQRSGAITNVTLTLALGNSSVDGWWQVRIEPRLVQQSFPNGTKTVQSGPMTLYVANSNGTTIFPIEQGELVNQSVSTSTSTAAFQFSALTIIAPALVAILAATAIIIYSRRRSASHTTTPVPHPT